MMVKMKPKREIYAGLRRSRLSILGAVVTDRFLAHLANYFLNLLSRSIVLLINPGPGKSDMMTPTRSL